VTVAGPKIEYDLDGIVKHFEVAGRFIKAYPYGSGHINDTYLGRFELPRGERKYIHQRINHKIFRQPESLMRNIQRVTNHLRQKIAQAGGDADRQALTLVPARDGQCFYRSPAGDYWRTYLFIDGARTYDLVETPKHLRGAGLAFGRFQRMLADLPGGPLHETIPLFHHTPNRVRLLEEAVIADPAGRAGDVHAQIDFALSRKNEMGVVARMLEEGQLPSRVTHNDTKFNNVMIDDATGEAICVIDLDTVMPGSSLYDFGDMVRTGATTVAEDATDLANATVSLEMFEALVSGYFEGAGDFLSRREREFLALSGKLITYTIGVRFLTDYLSGDVYFKVHRPGHNLDRCRNQFNLVSEIERNYDQMRMIVARHT
jgi:hypothetical protein